MAVGGGDGRTLARVHRAAHAGRRLHHGTGQHRPERRAAARARRAPSHAPVRREPQFSLGSRRLILPAQLAALDAEQLVHGDVLFLECFEGSGAGFSHGGRAVAEKALGWFVHAASHTASPHVAKADDDTELSLPRLAADLEALSGTLTLILALALALTPTLTPTLTLTRRPGSLRCRRSTS